METIYYKTLVQIKRTIRLLGEEIIQDTLEQLHEDGLPDLRRAYVTAVFDSFKEHYLRKGI